MGLYAAFLAARRGLDVTVLERDRVGSSLLGWGSVRLFSPLEMNIPAAVGEALPELPAAEALLTGPEMVERVLLPLARHPSLYDRVLTRRRVRSLGRAGLGRKDFPGHPVRHEKPFRLVVEGPEEEQVLEAEYVFDATGAPLPCALGAGGLPVPGERAAEGRFLRGLGDLDAYLDNFHGGGILLVGHGHSAAHALARLQAASGRDISVTWCFRSRNLRPVRDVADDVLPARAAAVRAANALAAAPPSFLDLRRGSSVTSFARSGSRLAVAFSSGSSVEVDAVAAFTGYRPDLEPLSELALDLSPATEGTRKLHAVLCGAKDCLSVPMPKTADLESGEPGFWLIGAKSYGRANTFLLRDGIRHVEMILDQIAG